MEIEQVMCGMKANLPTTEFELFDNVTDLLKPVNITLLFALIVRDHLQLHNSRNRFLFKKKTNL